MYTYCSHTVGTSVAGNKYSQRFSKATCKAWVASSNKVFM